MEHQLPASTSLTDGGIATSQLVVVRAGGVHNWRFQELAQAALLLLEADRFVAGGQILTPTTADVLNRGTWHSGAPGTRYELALLELLTREHDARLHDVVQQAFLHATTNSDVLAAVDSGERLRAIGFAREKTARIRGGVFARSADDLRSRLHQSAKLVTPAAGSRFPVLQPMADRDRRGTTRLDVLVTTPMSSRLEGFPPSADQLHHADLLVGTHDGRYWLGVDVKCSRQDRPEKRTRWSGIGLDVDLLIGDSFDRAARRARVNPHHRWFVEPGTDGVPRLTIGSAHDAFAALRIASDAIHWARTAGSYEVRHGNEPEDALARLVKEHMHRPLDELEQELQAAAGRLLEATDEQIARLGDGPIGGAVIGTLGR